MSGRGAMRGRRRIDGGKIPQPRRPRGRPPERSNTRSRENVGGAAAVDANQDNQEQPPRQQDVVAAESLSQLRHDLYSIVETAVAAAMASAARGGLQSGVGQRGGEHRGRVYRGRVYRGGVYRGRVYHGRVYHGITYRGNGYRRGWFNNNRSQRGGRLGRSYYFDEVALAVCDKNVCDRKLYTSFFKK
ncbi:uncharacterized protein LOC122503239 [Leptopilina heterotoma]|uniref:uncharacterized protein LOC122503239 n=1 Tax=Leptopilina heterotoma TaxID=63436 RepID=UPI001CA888FD|nr:uncharacterized protein LOC122503239 [Leptopilina heterotoma]